jgi:hypothetical protein
MFAEKQPLPYTVIMNMPPAGAFSTKKDKVDLRPLESAASV